MTDNFELFKNYILSQEPDFDTNSDTHYVVELIRRGKDNPDMPAANYHFKTYYIKKISDLNKYKDEIMQLCDMMHLRAYVSINVKSFKQIMLDTNAEIARRIAEGTFERPYAIYESCSGKYCMAGKHRWLIDVDKEDADALGMTINELVNLYINFVGLCKPNKKPIGIFPTKTGAHLITYPFDLKDFDMYITVANSSHYWTKDKIEGLVHKNHITLLYENLD